MQVSQPSPRKEGGGCLCATYRRAIIHLANNGEDSHYGSFSTTADPGYRLDHQPAGRSEHGAKHGRGTDEHTSGQTDPDALFHAIPHAHPDTWSLMTMGASLGVRSGQAGNGRRHRPDVDPSGARVASGAQSVSSIASSRTILPRRG